jgi:acyl carrier protein
VRWRADGELEFMERVDRQVKVRGFRIETGEVEAVMAEHPAVREAVVEVRGEARERRLVGYVVAAPDAPLDAAELRRHLGERLPDYMVPSAFVFLEALPVTPNGKTDRAALPEPRREADDLAEPRNEVEDAVAAVWRDVLGLERVGVHDNFFELGGHSLLLAQVHERLRESLALQIPIVDLFRFPTVAALAEHLGADAAGRRSTQGRGGERAAARRALARGRGRAGADRGQGTGNREQQATATADPLPRPLPARGRGERRGGRAGPSEGRPLTPRPPLPQGERGRTTTARRGAPADASVRSA